MHVLLGGPWNGGFGGTRQGQGPVPDLVRVDRGPGRPDEAQGGKGFALEVEEREVFPRRSGAAVDAYVRGLPIDGPGHVRDAFDHVQRGHGAARHARLGREK